MQACTAFSETLSTDEPEPIVPSGFNIFQNSLGQQMSSIFSGVRAELPSMGDLKDSDDEDEDEEDEEERASAEIDAQGHGRGSAKSPPLVVEELSSPAGGVPAVRSLSQDNGASERQTGSPGRAPAARDPAAKARAG